MLAILCIGRFGLFFTASGAAAAAAARGAAWAWFRLDLTLQILVGQSFKKWPQHRFFLPGKVSGTQSTREFGYRSGTCTCACTAELTVPSISAHETYDFCCSFLPATLPRRYPSRPVPGGTQVFSPIYRLAYFAQIQLQALPPAKDEHRRACASVRWNVPIVELNILNRSGRLPYTFKTLNPLIGTFHHTTVHEP